MRQIRINLNENYINREGERLASLLTGGSALLFTLWSLLLLANIHRTAVFYSLHSADLRKAASEQEAALGKITQRIGELSREEHQLSKFLQGEEEIIETANNMGRFPVTEIINRLEEVTQEGELYLDEFSIRGEEVFIYIRNPQVDPVRMVSTLETAFRRVVITEYSRDRMTLRLGDMDD